MGSSQEHQGGGTCVPSDQRVTRTVVAAPLKAQDHAGADAPSGPSPAAAGTRSARGRPYRLPVDLTPMQTASPSVRDRVAWLLGTSRLYAPDQAVSRRDVFIEQLHALGVVADSTRLSRWEAGRVGAPAPAVAGYERVLGLPEGTLLVAVEELAHAARATGTTDGPGWHAPTAGPDPVTLHHRLDAYFQAVQSGAATGAQWFDLCHLLTSRDNLYLLQHTWAQISELLAHELARSTGLAFTTRFAALRLLVAHAPSRRHAVRAIGAQVTNPATGFAIHPVSMLGEAQGPQAFDLLFRLLLGAPSHLRAGASWAVADTLSRYDVGDDVLRDVEAVTVEILHRASSAAHRMDAVNIYACLPRQSRERIAGTRIDAPSRRALALAGSTGELRPAAEAQTVSRRVADAVLRRMSTTHHVEVDQMLHRLVREVLFHARHDRRHHAALLLSSSPYRAVVADAMLQLGCDPDEGRAIPALHSLFLLAEPRHRSGLWELATTDTRTAVRLVAMMSLGGVIGDLDQGETATLHQELLAGPGPLARAALRLLGMAEGAPLDGVELSDGDLGEAVNWWRVAEPIRH